MKFSKIALGFCLISQLAFSQEDKALQYAETITADDLKKHLTVIAADDMEGRDTGSPGQKRAAQYISKHFFDIGLNPVVPTADNTKSYFQPFNLYKKGWGEAYIKLGENKKNSNFFQDFYPNGLFSVATEQQLPLVFVGYGIESENYSDYHDVDVKDKAVIFFDGEPIGKDGNFVSSRTLQPSEWSGSKGLTKKVALAKTKGAKHVFVIAASEGSSNEGFIRQARERKAMLSRYNRLSLEPSKDNASAASSFASMTVTRALAAEMLAVKKRKIKRLQKKINKSGVTTTGTIEESQLAFKAERGDETLTSENVLAIVEGSEKTDEYVFITAHYDHVGIDEKGQIYNGADDDGSGTCAVLEIAEAFAKAKAEGNGPKRNVVFMTVAGEEKGLLGSQYFTDKKPEIPLSKIVCDLNIDMIGRIDKDHKDDDKYSYLIGSDKLSSELHAISEETNKKYINFKLDYTYNDEKDPNQFYYRSDHYNFAKNKIPVIFYFTGVHEDYHRPTDDIEKILFPKYQQITRLVFLTAWNLANREERIKVDSQKK
jgi:Peptidase family M28